jgi:hypothetical protein
MRSRAAPEPRAGRRRRLRRARPRAGGPARAAGSSGGPGATSTGAAGAGSDGAPLDGLSPSRSALFSRSACDHAPVTRFSPDQGPHWRRLVGACGCTARESRGLSSERPSLRSSCSPRSCSGSFSRDGGAPRWSPSRRPSGSCSPRGRRSASTAWRTVAARVAHAQGEQCEHDAGAKQDRPDDAGNGEGQGAERDKRYEQRRRLIRLRADQRGGVRRRERVLSVEDGSAGLPGRPVVVAREADVLVPVRPRDLVGRDRGEHGSEDERHEPHVRARRQDTASAGPCSTPCRTTWRKASAGSLRSGAAPRARPCRR